MDHHSWLAEQFEEQRPHLRQVAWRMLGSQSEADDAVQEAWVRTQRSDTSQVENLGGWLTTVVARVCLDLLRARQVRREEPLDDHLPVGRAAQPGPGADPEYEALLADAMGPALLIVLDTLAPAERLAFVLHDLFGVPFEEIASMVGRSPVAARQLASRARRRVRGGQSAVDGDIARERQVVDAFLAAARNGEFEHLLELLDPDAVLRADQAAIDGAAANAGRGAPTLAPELHGAATVAEAFAGRARAARPFLVDGAVGAAWTYRGDPLSVFAFTVVDGRVVEIHILGDRAHIEALDLRPLARHRDP